MALVSHVSCVLAALALMGCADEAPAVALPPESHQEVQGWLALPEGMMLGRVLAVAVHPDGRVFVAHDAGHPSPNVTAIAEPTIFVVDANSGALLQTMGAGLFRYPHGLSFDQQGRLWVVDSDSNRVVRLGSRGEIELTLGQGEACSGT